MDLPGLFTMKQTVLSVIGVVPTRIGGTEVFARELSLQLGQHGWESVLCFAKEPSEKVRRFLDQPNSKSSSGTAR